MAEIQGTTLSAAVADGLASASEEETQAQGCEMREDTDGTDETMSAREVASDVSEAPEEVVFRPVYNGQEIALRASEQEEITTLLQLGMKQRDLLPTYERLSFLAKEDGASSVKVWVEQLVKDREEAYREEAVRVYGEEAGERYYALERREREQRYTAQDEQVEQRETARLEEQQRVERMASEWMVLQKQYPQYRSFEELPQEVVQTAAQERISLLDAHNRFLLAEQERCAREQTQHHRAAVRSTGSLRGEASAPPSPMEAFLKGLHSRV